MCIRLDGVGVFGYSGVVSLLLVRCVSSTVELLNIPCNN
jgi:hypothetical protein